MQNDCYNRRCCSSVNCSCHPLDDTNRLLESARTFFNAVGATISEKLDNARTTTIQMLPQFIRRLSGYCGTCCCCCNCCEQPDNDKDNEDKKSITDNDHQQQHHHFDKNEKNICSKSIDIVDAAAVTAAGHDLYVFSIDEEIKNLPAFETQLYVENITKSNKNSESTLKKDTPITQHREFEINTGSPISTKSLAYSQKSTASAKSSNGSERTYEKYVESEAIINNNDPTNNSLTTTTNSANTKKSYSSESDELQIAIAEETEARQVGGGLVVDDLETQETIEQPVLKRNESLNSLHSKSESIKTQLEDTTPQTLSRAQSTKSLVIEEELEDNSSFVVVEELQQLPPPPLLQELNAETLEKATRDLNSEMPLSRTPLPPAGDGATAAAAAKTQVRSISLDLSYERPHSKQGSLDTNSTELSSPTSSQLNGIGSATTIGAIPMKDAPTPLKEKSKTSYFMRTHRRVSPVKQAMKMSQPELYPQNMAKFEKPREALFQAFHQLDSPNWEINMEGLKSMVRLMRFHAEQMENQMHMVCIQLTRSVRNLRSQVARAACQAAAELFILKAKYLETECDDLVCALLQRTADTNRFIRADATRALESMCDGLQPTKILQILTTKGVQHQNALVRTTTAKLLLRLVERLGCERIYNMGRDNRDKIFTVSANLLLEGSLETRSYAKSIFKSLSEHPSYNRLLLDVIPQRTYRNIEKTLRNISR